MTSSGGVSQKPVPSGSNVDEILRNNTPNEIDVLVPVSENGAGDEGPQRNAWSSRVVFWLAAVGSAVGLGNLWRFPWQCATWGGGAFILAYVIALFTLGMPILTQELVLGQKHRSGDIEAFGRMNWRLRGIGLVSVLGAFSIVTYYMVVIGLSVVLFFVSFRKNLPYGADNPYYAYFDVMYLESGGIEESTGIMSGKLFMATMFAWVITFICIMRGVKTASIAVKFTMPLPIILLFVLLVKGLTLDGATDGVEEYFNFSNWKELGSSGIWNAAIGQCFFSLSVCMGVMTAYASYNPVDQNIAADEKVIAFIDIGVSLLSGFVVYSTLGYLMHIREDTDTTDWYSEASFGLVFVAYPVAIESFDGAQVFGVIFYLTLFLLGIDSAFSLVEAVTTVIDDCDLNKKKLKWKRTTISSIVCVAGAFFSSMYCFDTGLYWLDIIDRYVNNYGMIFLACCETVACGWFYRTDLQERYVGEATIQTYRIGMFISVLVGYIFSFSLASPEKEGGEYNFDYLAGSSTDGSIAGVIGFLVALVGWLITLAIAWRKREQVNEQQKQLTNGEIFWYIVGWENVECLRDFINNNGLGEPTWQSIKHTASGEWRATISHSTIGIHWGFFIKYFTPIVTAMNLLATMRNDSWNPYEDYPWGYLTVGILLFSLMVIMVAFVALFPQYMAQDVDEKDQNAAHGEDENALATVVETVEVKAETVEVEPEPADAVDQENN